MSTVATRLVLAVLVIATAGARQLQTPSDWRWRTDTTAPVVQSQDVPTGSWRFVAMPPGWHVTTGPGAVLYHPDYQGKGNYTVEAEIFLFPGESQAEYGVFLGGRNLDRGDSQGYVAFVARRDGKGAVIRAAGAPPVLDWTANDAILPHTGPSTVKNSLRVDVGAAEVVFSANGKDVARLPRANLGLDGHFGFRVGAGMNLHISSLNITHKLAPLPIK